MKYNILMDVIDNISKYSTKNVQMIDIDIIIHSCLLYTSDAADE